MVVHRLRSGGSVRDALREAGVSTRRVRWTREVFLDLARELARGRSISSLAREHGVTRQKVHQVVSRPNPLGLVVTWQCEACGHTWQNTSRDWPKRCRGCRSSAWRSARG